MDLETYAAEFANEVVARAAADADFTHSSFVSLAVERLADAGQVSDFEFAFYRPNSGTRKRAMAIDGYAFDRADDSLKVFLAVRVEDLGQRTLTRTDATPLFRKLTAFVEEALDGALEEVIDAYHPARPFIDDLVAERDNISRLRAYLITDATLSSAVKDWPEGDIRGIPITYNIWDIARFFRAHVSQSGQDDIVVDFAGELGGGLPCIRANTGAFDYDGYLCIIPGHVLATVYDRYGSRLLEGNVRAFLSTKGKVNADIRQTILRRGEMFFAYNNGISATADSIELDNADDGLRLVRASNLQIVNGGQTTASLASAKSKDQASLDGIFVSMKLSVVRPEKAAEMVPLISRYANSQNKVSEADFSSNHRFQQELERISRTNPAPAVAGAQHETYWFYERTRGQYINQMMRMTPAEQRRWQVLNPRGQVITKSDLARSEMSWRQRPQVVSKGAQSAFLDFALTIDKEWREDPHRFNAEFFRNAVARVIMFRAVERLVPKEGWFQGGYRANIVTYAIAKLGHSLEAAPGRTLDFDAIWRAQAVATALEEQLRLAARLAFEVLTWSDRPQQNVTQWAKRDECWKRLREMNMVLTDAFHAELIDGSAAKSGSRMARLKHAVGSGLSGKAAVKALGYPFWTSALLWAEQRGDISLTDLRLLKIAAGLIRVELTFKEGRRALELRDQFQQEGFHGTEHDERTA